MLKLNNQIVVKWVWSHKVLEELHGVLDRFLLGRFEGFGKERLGHSETKDLYLKDELFEWSPQHLWKLKLVQFGVLVRRK